MPSTGRKQLASWFNFPCKYIDVVLSINNPEFENTLGKMYPVELEIKDKRERATLLPFSWIYSCRSGGTVDSILPLMTNATISISISQIFRYWVAIIHLRPPMASFSRSSSDMSRPAPHLYVYFLGQRDFPISFSNRDTSRTLEIVIEKVSWSTRGSFQTIKSSSLKNIKLHSVSWPYKMTTLHRSDQIVTLLPNSTFYRIIRGFHGANATGVACQQGTLTPTDTWSCPFRTCICSTFWDQWHYESYITPTHGVFPYFTDYRLGSYYSILVSI